MNPFEGRAPQHIGYLVNDVDRVESFLGSTLGLPISPARERPVSVDVGEPTTLKVLFAQVGDVVAEFIQPTGGYWLEALEQRGPGVHHIAFANFGDEFDAAVETAASFGFTVPVAGHFGESKWAYLEAGGIVFELASGTGPRVESAARA